MARRFGRRQGNAEISPAELARGYGEAGVTFRQKSAVLSAYLRSGIKPKAKSSPTPSKSRGIGGRGRGRGNAYEWSIPGKKVQEIHPGTRRAITTLIEDEEHQIAHLRHEGEYEEADDLQVQIAGAQEQLLRGRMLQEYLSRNVDTNLDFSDNFKTWGRSAQDMAKYCSHVIGHTQELNNSRPSSPTRTRDLSPPAMTFTPAMRATDMLLWRSKKYADDAGHSAKESLFKRFAQGGVGAEEAFWSVALPISELWARRTIKEIDLMRDAFGDLELLPDSAALVCRIHLAPKASMDGAATLAALRSALGPWDGAILVCEEADKLFLVFENAPKAATAAREAIMCLEQLQKDLDLGSFLKGISFGCAVSDLLLNRSDGEVFGDAVEVASELGGYFAAPGEVLFASDAMPTGVRHWPDPDVHVEMHQMRWSGGGALAYGRLFFFQVGSDEPVKPMNKKDIDKLFKKYDTQDSGLITWDSWCSLLSEIYKQESPEISVPEDFSHHVFTEIFPGAKGQGIERESFSKHFNTFWEQHKNLFNHWLKKSAVYKRPDPLMLLRQRPFDPLVDHFLKSTSDTKVDPKAVERAHKISGSILCVELSNFTSLTRRYGIIHTMLLIAQERQVMKCEIKRVDGKLVSLWCGSVVASFESPAAALACCISVDEILTEINKQRNGHEQIRLCGGLEHGDYVCLGKDLFGPGWDMCCALGAAAAEDCSTLMGLHMAGNEGVAHCSSCETFAGPQIIQLLIDNPPKPAPQCVFEPRKLQVGNQEVAVQRIRLTEKAKDDPWERDT